jgi:hypothetical protein
MKKLTFFTAMSALISIDASAQDISQFSNARLSYFATSTPLYAVSMQNTNSLSDGSLTPGYDKRASNKNIFLRNSNELTLNLSPQTPLQYGVAVSVETPLSENLSHKFDSTENKATVSPSVFLNYRFSPNYSLVSALSYSNAAENSRQFSLGGRATGIFKNKHRITAVFNINRYNQDLPVSDLLMQADRKFTASFNPNPSTLTRTDLRFSTSWHWNLDTSWSLNTGITVKHMLKDPNNPFTTQRTPVTIFSVATYRF